MVSPRSSTRQVAAAWASSAIAGLEAAYFGWSLHMIGFPDGHRTALDRWRESTYPVFTGLLGAAAVVALVAAVRRRPSWAVPVAVVALGLACLAFDQLGATRFDHGGGG